MAEFDINCDLSMMEEVAAKLRALSTPSAGHKLYDLQVQLRDLGDRIYDNGTLVTKTAMDQRLEKVAENLEKRRQTLWSTQDKLERICSAVRSTEERVAKILTDEEQVQ